MTRTFIFLFILLSADIFSQDKIASTNPALLYNQTAFDSDTCCWRKLCSDKKYLDAANLIVSYLKNSKPTNKHSLNWHAGQMFAMAHSDKLAKKYFKRTYSLFYKWFGDTDAKTWYYYAKGTIAFIDNGKKSLEKTIKTWATSFPQTTIIKFWLDLMKIGVKVMISLRLCNVCRHVIVTYLRVPTIPITASNCTMRAEV